MRKKCTTESQINIWAFANTAILTPNLCQSAIFPEQLCYIVLQLLYLPNRETNLDSRAGII